MSQSNSNHDTAYAFRRPFGPICISLLMLSLPAGCSSDKRGTPIQATQGTSSSASGRSSDGSGSGGSAAQTHAAEGGGASPRGSADPSPSSSPSGGTPGSSARGVLGSGGKAGSAGAGRGVEAADGGGTDSAGAAAAPSSDAGTPAQGSTGAGSGGTASPTSASGAGGTSGGLVDDGTYTFVMCPNAMPPTAADGQWSDFGACDGTVQCGGEAHCLPTERLKARLSDAVLERIPDCSTGKCVPDQLLLSGKVRFNTCDGDFGDGRCIPQCFAVWVMPLAVIFERGAYGCGSQEVCTPCINPVDQTPSGACESDMCAADE